jgi:hypothetical protein
MERVIPAGQGHCYPYCLAGGEARSVCQPLVFSSPLRPFG